MANHNIPHVHFQLAGIDGAWCYAFSWRTKQQRFPTTRDLRLVTCQRCINQLPRFEKKLREKGL